jgi:hypothetical protein
MSDKLDWLNRHLTLLRYTTVADAVAKEGYKIRPDLEAVFAGTPGAESMVYKLADAGDYTSADELRCYIAHRRAAVWWGYRCVVDLYEEVAQNPPVDQDIADIAADFSVHVPDWAKVEIPKPDPKALDMAQSLLDQTKASLADIEATLDQDMLKFLREAVEVAFQEFKRVHGIHPIDLLKQVGKTINDDPVPLDPKSPAFVETDKIRAQIQVARADAVDTIKSVLPPKTPAHDKQVRDNALGAVYRWVVAPDAENAQKCQEIGADNAGTPAGLLTLAAFWAYGNLTPLADQVVPTPAGLAANGLSQVLLLCSLEKGGFRKPKERYERYFQIGVDVITGKDNWGETVADHKAPHEEHAPASPQPAPRTVAPTRPVTYHRWKPE